MMSKLEPQGPMDAFIPPMQSDYYDNNDQLASSLDILAQVVHILDIPDASFYNYSTAITYMVTKNMALSRSLDRLTAVEEELKDHMALLEHESRLLAHWNKALTPGSSTSLYPESSATLERRKDAVVKKAKEYHKALETLMAEEPLETPVTMAQFMAQKEKNQAKQRELKEKRAKLKTFQGLPPSLELAHHELGAARQRQMELIQLRERLLARMAASVS